MLPRAKIIQLVFICLLLWLAMVVTLIPAHWAAWLVNQAAPLQLSQISGSFWKGRAASAQLQIDEHTLSMGTLDWDLNPWSLLILRPCLDVKTKLNKQKLSGEWCFGLGGIGLHDTEFSASAELAQLWLPVNLQGQISGQIQEATIDGEARVTALNGNINWNQARYYNGRHWMTLGAYAAKLSNNQSGGVSAQIFDLSGPIQVKMELSTDDSIAISGNITLKEDAPTEFAQWLPLIAEQAADGSYNVDWSM